MKKPQQKLWVTLLILLSVGMSLAQAPGIEWQKSFGGSFTDSAEFIEQTTDGGFIATGYSYSNDGDVSGNHGGYDFWIVKLNQMGSLEWQKSHGGSNDDVATSLQQTMDDGYIIAGGSKSSNGDVLNNKGGFDFWIMRLDETGEFDGQTSMGGSGDDIAYSIQQTLDGGYIIAGESNSTDFDVTGNHGGYDYWVVKTNSQGSIEWQKSLGGSGNDRAKAIRQTTDGGYIVAGHSNSSDGDVSGNHGNGDIWIVKLNDQGIIEWQKAFGGSGVDGANSIQQTIDGGYIIAGASSSNDGDVTENQGSYDYWVVKINSTGIIEWQNSFGGSDDDTAHRIQQTIDGGYIIAGASLSNDGDITENRGNFDYWIVKINSTGIFEWQKSLGGSGSDHAKSISQATDGGYIVAGHSASNNGDVTENHGLADFWIVKLDPDPLDIDDFKSQINVYPNPTSDFLNISAGEPIISISVFNQIGQKILTSTYNKTEVQLNISSLTTNLYFVEVKTEHGSETYKIMVQ